MTYSFDSRIAEMYGVDEAVFIHAAFINEQLRAFRTPDGTISANIKLLQSVMPFYSEHQLILIIKKLLLHGLVFRSQMPAEKIKDIIIKSKAEVANCGMGSVKCAWCGTHTAILHDHHYPVKRSDGGTKTVSICPNCHTEFHYLSAGFLNLSEKGWDYGRA